MQQLHWLSAHGFCWRMKLSVVAWSAASPEVKTLQWPEGLAEVPANLNLRGISCSSLECSFPLWAGRAAWSMHCQLETRHSVGYLCSINSLAVRLHAGRSFSYIYFAFIFERVHPWYLLLALTCYFPGVSFSQPAQRYEQVCGLHPKN